MFTRTMIKHHDLVIMFLAGVVYEGEPLELPALLQHLLQLPVAHPVPDVLDVLEHKQFSGHIQILKFLLNFSILVLRHTCFSYEKIQAD